MHLGLQGQSTLWLAAGKAAPPLLIAPDAILGRRRNHKPVGGRARLSVQLWASSRRAGGSGWAPHHGRDRARGGLRGCDWSPRHVARLSSTGLTTPSRSLKDWSQSDGGCEAAHLPTGKFDRALELYSNRASGQTAGGGQPGGITLIVPLRTLQRAWGPHAQAR